MPSLLALFVWRQHSCEGPNAQDCDTLRLDSQDKQAVGFCILGRRGGKTFSATLILQRRFPKPQERKAKAPGSLEPDLLGSCWATLGADSQTPWAPHIRTREELLCKIVGSLSVKAGYSRDASAVCLELLPSLDSCALGIPSGQPGLRARDAG